MKKIIVAIDGSYYSEVAVEYALQLASRYQSFVAGVFLEDVTAYHQFSPLLEAPEAVGLAEEVLLELRQESKDRVQSEVDRFSARCSRAGVSWGIVEEAGIPSRDLINETLYADLCIVGAVTYFGSLTVSPDAGLLTDVLSKAHCPVLVVPEEAAPLSDVVLTYDGSVSSVNAIKRYLSLFPSAADDWTHTLVTVVAGNHTPSAQETDLLRYLRHHIPDLRREVLTGDTVQEILHYASQFEGSLLVMGAFTRNILSTMMKPSVGKQVVKAHLVPVLVAH